jgi:6-O-methylguanine DNA methyltransferase, DNA binding domain
MAAMTRTTFETPAGRFGVVASEAGVQAVLFPSPRLRPSTPRGAAPAAAIARNPLPLVVPCHRVVAANGLGGYGGGLPLKRRLLALEGVLTPELPAAPALSSPPTIVAKC